MAERHACFWATPCGRGCYVGANYQSTTVHLPPALETGNLDIISNAHCREVTDQRRRQGHRRRCSSTRPPARRPASRARRSSSPPGACETVRILLNSKGPRRHEPGQLQRPGRQVHHGHGRHARCSGHVPIAGKPPAAQRGRRRRRPLLLALVALQGAEGRQARLRPRVPHRDRAARATCPAAATRSRTTSPRAATARKFKEDARRYYGSFVGFAARGEMIPNEHCYMDLDPQVKDKFGIPVAPLPLEVERPRAEPGRARQATFAALIEAMGGTVGRSKDFKPERQHPEPRLHHPRGRRRDHRRRPEEVGLQPVEPDLGREEPVPVPTAPRSRPTPTRTRR